MNKKVVIIGAGASGVICAIKLKHLNPKTEVIVIEQNDKILKKLLKTGNGRCNISNDDIKPNYYNNQDYVRSCFEKFSVADLIQFFKNMGLLIKRDSENRLYPYSETATSVVEVLKYEIDRLGIIIRLSEKLESFQYDKSFIIKTDKASIKADYLVMATGGIAQEVTNAYNILKNHGHIVSKLRPGLVPFKVKNSLYNLKHIQGIRVKCLAKVMREEKIIYQETGEILFKEQGISGILALNLSRYVKINDWISLDLFYERDTIVDEIQELLRFKSLNDVLLGILPKNLALEIFRKNLNLENNLELLRDLRFEVSDYYGYEIAQITIGGVHVNEVNDFQSIYHKNLYIIGEVLDIDGASGGYNLHFAWVSGILAATSINKNF